MYRCEACDVLFEELAFVGDNGLVHRGCPNCGSDQWTEFDACDACKDEFPVDELYHGYCETCLKLKCTYDAALDFMESRDLLGKFFFWMFNDGSEPQYIGRDLLEVFAEIYRRRKANDLLTNSHEWLDAVQEFILDSDGYFGKDEFANFLVETEGEQ